jgi:hypothetical protein
MMVAGKVRAMTRRLQEKLSVCHFSCPENILVVESVGMQPPDNR